MELIIFLILLLLVVIGVGILVYLKRKSFGVLSQKHLYSDSDARPGEVLYDDSLFLKGKPDYIVSQDNTMIPVEVKTGKTPSSPYQNHIVQVIVYCMLIERNYDKKPPYGVIKYPDKEFQIEYSDEKRTAVTELMEELSVLKQSGIEPKCDHVYH